MAIIILCVATIEKGLNEKVSPSCRGSIEMYHKMMLGNGRALCRFHIKNDFYN